jgi:hypothetical protein
MPLKINRLTRKIHKWISIGFGVFLLIWLITGIVYVLPVSVLNRIDRLVMGQQKVKISEVESYPVENKLELSRINFRDTKVSIPDAISVLETEIGHEIQVVDCSLNRILNRLVYEITLKDGKKFLVDAVEGKLTEMTELEIKKIAIAAGPSDSNIVNISFFKKRPYAYWGPIPIYRFTFDDISRTHLYISPTTGQVKFKNQGWNRIREWFLSLHKFEFLILLFKSDSFRKGMLLILSMIGLIVTVSGFYLALPARIRNPKRKSVMKRR